MKRNYRYALESNNPTCNDDGDLWEGEAYYSTTATAEYITKENAYAWDMFDEDESSEVLYVWVDGDFENRRRFLVKTEMVLRFVAEELEEDDDPREFQ